MNPRDRLRWAALAATWLGAPRLFARPLGAPAQPRFVVYYGAQGNDSLYGHDVAVLDSEVDAGLLGRFDRSSMLLGYLSLGEVHQGRSYAAEMAQQGLLLPRNPNWPEAHCVDVRDARWTRRVCDQLVPALLARGFNGVFLDTLDTVAHLDASHAGMLQAGVELVRTIRRRFPELTLMANRGYAMLPQVVTDIDLLLGESVHSTYDAASRRYVAVAPQDQRWQLDHLQAARRLHPGLRLFSLDYWAPEDRAGIARLYAQARANGLVPYVATIDLTRVVPRA